MPINLKSLAAQIMAADLDGLARLTLCEVEELKGGDDGVGSVAAALVQGTLWASGSQSAYAWRAAWDGGASEPEWLARMGDGARGVARTLARVALSGDPNAAAKAVWDLCGGEAMQLFAPHAVWVAGPEGLAIYGGTSREGITGWESSVQVATWAEALAVLEVGDEGE